MKNTWHTAAEKSTAFARIAGLGLLLGVWAGGARAHGGEDHGDAAPVAVGSPLAPRATAQTEDFELVAQLNGSTLTLTLDRFASNEPVQDAQIEVESASALKAVATQVAPGVYTLPAPQLAVPGSYPLSIAVQAGDTADLLAVTLTIAAPAAGAVHVHGWGEWATWGVSGAVLAFGLALVMLRQRKRNRRS